MSRAVSTIESLTAHTPEQATADLAAMTEAFLGGQKLTPAADKLASMVKTAGQVDNMRLGGRHSDGISLPDGAAFENFEKAVADAQAEGGSLVDMAIAGHLGDVNPSDYLQMVQTANVLRSEGMGEEVIRQHLSGAPVSREEFARVSEWKRAAMEDPEWSKGYLAGDPEKVRAMNNAMVVLTSPIKEAAA
jgi:hypothetical protein